MTPSRAHHDAPRPSGRGRAVRGRAHAARLAAWARALALVVAFAFGRATVVPPCDAHGAGGHEAPAGSAAVVHGGAADAHHHGDGAVPAQGEAPHGDTCTCLGACHGAVAAAWLASEPARVPAPVVRAPAAHPPVARPAVARANHPHVLPYSTAPPTQGA